VTGYTLKLGGAEVVRYRKMAEGAVATERDLWARAGIVAGATVADVGCGPGAVSVLLAEAVGPQGRVRAVDADPYAAALAAELAARTGLSNVETSVADAAATGLAAGGMDVVMIRNVLAHNGGREQTIVDHLADLVRPGGCVYLADADSTALRVRPLDEDLEDLFRRYAELHERRGNDIAIGLRLAELLRAAGLEPIEFRGRYAIISMPPGVRGPAWAAHEAMVEAGLADDADVARWNAAFERSDARQERPTVFAPAFVGIGRSPGGPTL
jgi:SAM-dependent methyltransferase